jgi:glycosyltransferase involved in cell wall biosynthesis
MVAARLHKAAGVPFVLTAHGSDVPGYNRERLQWAHRFARPWWRTICRRAERLVSPSASLLAMARRHARGAAGLVIPNGFRPGRFRPLPKEQRILLCGRLVERKGFHYFLKAIADLPLPGWIVDVVGDGPQREPLEALARRCQVPVRMHGWLDNDSPELAELYGRAAIAALPSEWENFSIALLEAMSAGCAVITTNISGNPEAIGQAGRLVPPKDAFALRQAVMELTSDQAARLRLGEAARRRALGLFPWPVIAARNLEVLKSIRRPAERRDSPHEPPVGEPARFEKSAA